MATPKFPLLTTNEISDMIDACIPNERNRKILKRRLCDGITFEKIAEEFDLTARRVMQIVDEAGDSLFLQ